MTTTPANDENRDELNSVTEQPKQQPDQEELRRRYEEQQRRLACPGCGEEPFLG